MHLADERDVARGFGERVAHRHDAIGRRVAAGKSARLQRLDMGLDLDHGSELAAHRGLQPVRDFMCLCERQAAVDLESSETESRDAIACTVT